MEALQKALAEIIVDRAFWGEAIKLAAQLGGALVIARLTVGWALHRYKSEKAWEREVAAFTNLISALSERIAVAQAEKAEQASGENVTDAQRRSLTERDIAAFKILTDVRSTASITLPDEVIDQLNEMDVRLREIGDPDYLDGFWYEYYDRVETIITLARDEVVRIGRKRLRA